MTERPILFSAPMVRALLAGTKTQTRRLMKPQPDAALCDTEFPAIAGVFFAEEHRGKWIWPTADAEHFAFSPYGKPGDTLYVRETFRLPAEYDDTKPKLVRPDAPVWYDATTDRTRPEGWGKTRVSIHMPRWASRLTLRITDVRVERLNDCSEADALAEGIERIRFPEVGEWGWPQRKYRELWEHINGPGSWAANPWVWAVSFERV